MIKHLGLAYKAGKIKLGVDLSIICMQKNQAHLVLLAHDASESTKKKMRDKTSYYGIELIESYSSVQMSSSLGRDNIKVVTVIDAGFKTLIKSNEGSDNHAKTI